MLSELKEKNEIINIFCELAEIPSPSLQEDNVINWIKEYSAKNNFNYETDECQNIHISIPATDPTKQPMLLSAHMDVVGDNSPVIPYVEGKFIKAKDRTLGADDKVGVAQALLLAKSLTENSDTKHGGLEIVFTRDEENSMTGIRNLDFSKLKSKNVFVLDSDSLGQCMMAGASYISGKLHINAPKGGHSGNDIGDETRQNAAKLLVELLNTFPQGVYKSDENGQPATSINIGGIASGNLKVTNVINTDADATFSIRSTDMPSQTELIELLQANTNDFNKEYEGVAHAELEIREKMPMFVNNGDTSITTAFSTAAKKCGIIPEIGTFHAGAETHIYALNKNSKGETFSPYLLGLATICNMHSSREQVDYETILSGQELLKTFFEEYQKL